jgi:hypothetical protein
VRCGDQSVGPKARHRIDLIIRMVHHMDGTVDDFVTRTRSERAV